VVLKSVRKSIMYVKEIYIGDSLTVLLPKLYHVGDKFLAAR
jgi:hypothetical protein